MTRPSVLRSVALRVPAVAILLSAGCASPKPSDIRPEQSSAAALGLADPIEFRTIGPEGSPLDEPSGVGDRLGMADALERAVRTSPKLQASLANVRIAIAESDQARLLPNPILSFVIRWGPGKSQIETSLTQDLIRALQTPTRASAADNRLRAAAADAVTTALDVGAEVQLQYAAAQAAAARTPLLKSRMGLMEQLERIAQSRLSIGEGSKADLATLSAQRVRIEVELSRAQRDEREARLKLARLIGEPSGSATWALDSWTPPSTTSVPEDAFIRTALTHRPELQSLGWELAALGDDAALSRVSVWEPVDAGVDATRDDDWRVGPTISTPIPIFDTGSASRAAAAARIQRARHELSLAKRLVIEEVRTSYATLASSLENLTRVRSTLLPLQESRRQIAEDAYRAGMSDITTLYLAEQDLSLAAADAIETEHEVAIALISLQRAVGGPALAAQTHAASSPKSDDAHSGGSR